MDCFSRVERNAMNITDELVTVLVKQTKIWVLTFISFLYSGSI